MIALLSEGNGVVPRELKKNIQRQEDPGVYRML